MIGYHHVLMIIIALAIILLCEFLSGRHDCGAPRVPLECH